MCVCVYVCMYVCAYIRPYVSMYIVHMYVWMYVCPYISTYVHVCVCTDVEENTLACLDLMQSETTDFSELHKRKTQFAQLDTNTANQI